MNKPDLSITRAQYGENDAKLWQRRSGVSPHLSRPPVGMEIDIRRIVGECRSAEEFVRAVDAFISVKEVRATMVRCMRQDGKKLKARDGLSSAEVRDLKASFIHRWMERQAVVVGIPGDWLIAWMKALKINNAKGKLSVEFGGDP